MHVSRQAVAALEKSESLRTVRLSTLAAAADALGCRLIYAIVPVAGDLEGIVRAQASRVVDIEHAAAARTMLLEGIVVEPLPTDRQDTIEDILRAPGRIWRRTDLE